MGVSSFAPMRVPQRPPAKIESGVSPSVALPTRREIWNRREAEREVELMLSGRGDEYCYQPMPELWIPEERLTYFNLDGYAATLLRNSGIEATL